MKNYFLNKSITTIDTKYKLDDETKEVLIYGLEGVYLTFTKAIIISLLALKLNLFKELIILLIFYNIIRMVSFGLHAKSSIVCLLSSTIIFLGIPYICKIVHFNHIIKITLFIVVIILIAIFSPADTEKRPIISKKRRSLYKIASIIISISYMIIGLNINSNFLSNILLFSLIIQLFLINPLSYKLFNLSYNNYKKYSLERGE